MKFLVNSVCPSFIRNCLSKHETAAFSNECSNVTFDSLCYY